MGPAIGRSIGHGFRAANGSWAGMACYAGCWVGVFMLVFLAMALSGVPRELFQAPVSTTPPPAQAAPQNAVAPADPAAPAPTPAARGTTAADQNRLVGEWLGRAWPVLALVILLLVAAGTWLYGGQIGYLAARVRGEAATVATFCASGTRAFWSLLGSSLLSIVFMIGAMGSVAGLLYMSTRLPQALAGVLSVLIALIAGGGLGWLFVRLVFWFIAVVAGKHRPLAGLLASFALTRGKWWKTFGLVVLVFLMSLGATVLFNLLNGLGTVLGGPAGAMLQALTVIVQVLVVNLYLSFAITAALIRFYEDAKVPAPQP